MLENLKEITIDQIDSGFKRALLWINEENFEADEFTKEAEKFIKDIINKFIREIKLWNRYEFFEGDSVEYSLGEQLGFDLFLSVCGIASFSDREYIYKSSSKIMDEKADELCINNVWENSNGFIEVE